MHNNDTLQHHGIKGMHWGVRKDKNVQSAKASMKANKKASKSNAKKAAYKQAKSKSVTRQQHKAAVQNAKKASISLARVAKKTALSKPVSTAKILLGASMMSHGISGMRHASSSDVYTKIFSGLFALSGYTIARNGAYKINKAIKQ